MEALFLAVSEFAVGAQHDLEMARQIFLAEQVGDAANAGALIGGNLQQRRILTCDLGYRDIAQEAQQLARKVRGTVALKQGKNESKDASTAAALAGPAAD